MSTRKWTENQQSAIDARRGSILISAAAGSGKTAVLVQRVIETLTDKVIPCDADKLLIVTFTNAAAAEMRERISARINELIEESPFDANLKKQRLLLANAHISTIHSFCSDLIRENFYKLNVSSNFKIADSNEMVLLRKDAINKVLELKYSENNPEFINLVETFGSAKDDSNLLKIINQLYEFIRSHPFPNFWLDQKLGMYDSNISIKETVFGEVLLSYATMAINHCVSLMKNLLALILEEPAFFDAYNASFEVDLAALSEIKSSIASDSWDEIASKINMFKQATLKRLTGYKDDPLKLKITENRKEIKSILDELKGLFSFSESDCIDDTVRLHGIVKELFSIIRLFSQEIDAIKSSRNICDFGDLEHLTLKLLVKPSEDGFERTPEAVELSKKFQHIMVDEYQDTNEAQDMIFRAISNNEGNLFTVGDVKQSIYRFRQAMPEIFLRRKESYSPYVKTQDNYPGKIILDKNFRSRFEILDCINFIFHQVMSQEVGDMEYTSEEELHLGAAYPAYEDNRITLEIIDSSESEEKDMDVLEARRVANIVHELIGKNYKVAENGVLRDVTYKDFCVLLRSISRHANTFLNELAKNGIPAISDVSSSFFNTVEIATMISLLNIINNPLDDISFVSAVTSPIFSLSYDELIEIRAIDINAPIYKNIKKAAESGNDKCSEILKTLDKLRLLSINLSCSDLINYIYEITDYTCLVQAMPMGHLKLNNLRLLVEYAKTFESTSQKGLWGFIKFINKLRENKEDLAATSPSLGIDNAVRIMSIHRSKGLEFPICILANCSRKFNKDSDDILLHPELGIGIKLIDKVYEYRYSSFQREAVKLSLESDSLSEELRVLYVALTRAKEKLIMLTTLSNPYKSLLKLSSQITSDKSIAPYVVRSRNSFSDWILMCALRHPSGNELRKMLDETGNIVVPNDTHWEINIVTPENVELEENLENRQDTSAEEKGAKGIFIKENSPLPPEDTSTVENSGTYFRERCSGESSYDHSHERGSDENSGDHSEEKSIDENRGVYSGEIGANQRPCAFSEKKGAYESFDASSETQNIKETVATYSRKKDTKEASGSHSEEKGTNESFGASFETKIIDENFATHSEKKCANEKVGEHAVAKCIEENANNPSIEKIVVDNDFFTELHRRFTYTYPFKNLTVIPQKVTVTDIVSARNKKNFSFNKKPNFLLNEPFSPSQKGAILHRFMQFADLNNASINLELEIKRLLNDGYFTQEEAITLDRTKIGKFLSGELAQRIINSSKVLREYKFMVKIDAREYDKSLPEEAPADISLQGAIDCAFMEGDEYVIVDYKTDKVKSLEETTLYYKKQLELYNKAFMKCTGKKIKQNILYLFYTNKTIFL